MKLCSCLHSSTLSILVCCVSFEMYYVLTLDLDVTTLSIQVYVIMPNKFAMFIIHIYFLLFFCLICCASSSAYFTVCEYVIRLNGCWECGIFII